MGMGKEVPSLSAPSRAADHSPQERGPVAGCSVFWMQESINTFSEKLRTVPVVPLVQNLRQLLCVAGTEEHGQAGFSPPAPTLPGGGSTVGSGERAWEGFGSFEDGAWPAGAGVRQGM